MKKWMLVVLVLAGSVSWGQAQIKIGNRTIHTRMREYLYELKNNEALVTSIIPLGDGIALSVKKDK